jgi:hypothetical protein
MPRAHRGFAHGTAIRAARHREKELDSRRQSQAIASIMMSGQTFSRLVARLAVPISDFPLLAPVLAVPNVSSWARGMGT